MEIGHIQPYTIQWRPQDFSSGNALTSGGTTNGRYRTLKNIKKRNEKSIGNYVISLNSNCFGGKYFINGNENSMLIYGCLINF